MTKDIQRRQVLAAIGALAATGPLLATPALAQGTPIRVGYQNTSWGAIAMIAAAEKTFEAAGANVQLLQFADGKSTRDAMVSGRVDVGVLGATPFIVGAAKSDMLALAACMYAGRTNAVVAAKDSGIKTIADLKGKRVASQLGSATDSVFQNKILAKYGLGKADVQGVNVSFQNQVASLVSKSVDAFAGVEPFPSIAEVEGIGTVLVDYADFDMQPVFLSANRAVVDKRQPELVKFMRGWLAAARILEKDPKRATQIVFNHFKSQGMDIKEPVVARMLSKVDADASYRPNLVQYLDESAADLVKQKQIDAAPDWKRVLETRTAAEAARA
ncbi:Putative aliphatic sulfonates-binding protein precursor [Variovorax sp. PBL-H6]|uniref:ABC transporter substrate-binding protein n=1 Tax=Variovorax sp. PBL-H6 TaxID=434009 RepID=UPI001316B0E9|nr:ABC transporter substrate-binding protein [Variovorax sp. PBL-H6]VTU16249.1 Putative aliphatic sulfonates-binding protein precursor [Variovorax sp. PBL-H6]